ncbi:MAG: 4-alpha-glucanotransferase [Lawsonibacter sp.]|nr:4-alpha-glucanotransferase [Lawsonibacter sp.]
MYDYRSSGILLSVSSLPGPYGIGSLGAPARRFVDFLAEAGQHYWQILPLVPPGDGASPYMSPSAFAGNPYFIDLDELAAQGLLTTQELDSARREDPDRVDYEHLAASRMELLRAAFRRAQAHPALEDVPDLPWLEDYAAFAALHDRYQAPFRQWPADAPPPTAEEKDFHRFLQREFYRQWFDLKEYANKRCVRIMGDIPFYLSGDSTEVWKRPELFQLDEDGHLANVAGVPPDAFTDQGQLWGNPLYDWEGHKEQVFAFWLERLGWCARIYDAVRIDHFRALHTYWSVPAGAESAKEGHWEKGPGMELLDRVRAAQPNLELIAEDLGDLDAEALKFVRTCGIPGMKVLVFAFDPVGESAYLPHNCQRDSVVYTGTHDTPTFVQWLEEGDTDSTMFARRYLRLREDEGLGWGVVSGAWAAGSRLAIAPMQDVLALGADARMNTPGTMGRHNWAWRVRQEAFNPYVSGKLREITRTYRR